MQEFKLVSIVDDDESIRTSTESLVRSMGWHARAFESADQFLESLAASELGRLGCIVSDIQMPGTTGVEMLRKLRAGHHKFTIIFVTGFFSEHVKHEAMSEGALCVLEKPADPNVLCEWMCRAFATET